MSPILAKDWMNFALRAAMTMSQASAMLAPAPAATVAARNAEKVIRRGDPLMIEAGSDGFSITREGVALGDAAAGERLMVKVADGRMPVQAVAIEAGRATLPGWGDQ